MTTNFKEWLAEQAEREAGVAERVQRVREWQDSVDDLFNRIDGWLAEDDPKRILMVERGTVRKAEEGLGSYEIAALRITLGVRVVDLKPLARNTVGTVRVGGGTNLRAEGRVDMTTGGEKYMLYRAVTPGGKVWLLLDDTGHATQELNKETFEAALQDLLS